jgi:predicted peptidase
MDPDFLYRYTVDTLSDRLLKSKSILIFPAAWYLGPWWSESQFNNLNQLVWWVKERYNVDENRIRLSGISDGGIGSYYFANCDQTLWSSITPFIGSARALKNLGDRQVYFNNFRNSSLLIVNTVKDHIFKLSLEKPYIQSLQKANEHVSFIQVDSSGHSLAWFPILKDSIDRFVAANVRNSYPDQLIWQTDNVEKYNRFRYLIIEKLGKTKTGGNLSDVNVVTSGGIEEQAFNRDKTSGIVE